MDLYSGAVAPEFIPTTWFAVPFASADSTLVADAYRISPATVVGILEAVPPVTPRYAVTVPAPPPEYVEVATPKAPLGGALDAATALSAAAPAVVEVTSQLPRVTLP